MPTYTYRRSDGTTFDYRQKFTDEPLATCPTTGQMVVRVVQPTGIVFKGSGFYVNDSKGASRSSINNTASTSSTPAATTESPAAAPAPAATATEAKSEAKPTLAAGD